MYCTNCGKEVADDALYCPHCGAKQEEKATATDTIHVEVVTNEQTSEVSSYSRGMALILAFVACFGVSGIHRFYVGKIGTGILWLLTGGCFGIGTLIDIIMIASGSFTDIDGKCLTDWDIK